MIRRSSGRSIDVLPRDWLRRLPDPVTYYERCLASLGPSNPHGWAQSRCPFHDDHEASLSVHLVHGGWHCFAGCGQGDLVAFHRRLNDLTFVAAVLDLLRWRP